MSLIVRLKDASDTKLTVDGRSFHTLILFTGLNFICCEFQFCKYEPTASKFGTHCIATDISSVLSETSAEAAAVQKRIL